MDACRISDKFDSIECRCPADSRDPEGLCLLHSRYEDKDADGAFTGVLKEKLAREDYDFRGVLFPGPFSLDKLTRQAKFTFTKPADFRRAKFSEADFRGALFTALADFAEATFTGKVDFSKAIFTGLADFSGATFRERALYWATTFGEADFSGANLKKADFTVATFKGRTQFVGATFSGPARFVRINARGKELRLVFSGEFGDLTLDQEAALLFQDVSLERVRFAGTDVASLTFRNVVWHPCHSPVPAWLINKLPSRWQGRFGGRQAVYEEILLRERAPKFWDLFLKYGWKSARRLIEAKSERLRQEDYARVEELYRGLKLNYGKAGDFKQVGDFHFGEMEMHRRASAGRRWVSWYSIYWALSGYGERPLRAVICLAGLILGLAALFFWLEPKIAGGWGGLRDALFYILAQATFQRPDWFKPETSWGKLIRIISPLLIPGQAALFLLALRNRLGRRR